MFKKNSRLVAVLAALGLSVAGASANSITVTQTGAVDTVGGSNWDYQFSFVNSTLHNGDYVTINDFGPAGLVIAPGVGWAFSQALVGPNSLPATDDPSTWNVTFTWTGGNVVISPNAATLVNQSLTLFSPASVGPLVLSEYTTIDHVTSGQVAGTSSRVIGSVATPSSQVPDGGSTLALCGFALAGIEMIRRKLNR